MALAPLNCDAQPLDNCLMSILPTHPSPSTDLRDPGTWGEHVEWSGRGWLPPAARSAVCLPVAVAPSAAAQPPAAPSTAGPHAAAAPGAAAQPPAAPSSACLPAAAAAVVAAQPPAAPYVEVQPTEGPATVAVDVASAMCQQLVAPSAAGQPAAGAIQQSANAVTLPTRNASNAIDLQGRRLMTKGDTLERGAREQAGKQQPSLNVSAKLQNTALVSVCTLFGPSPAHRTNRRPHPCRNELESYLLSHGGAANGGGDQKEPTGQPRASAQ
ncbi:hypothetical protein HaLaN_27910 [Haematococcus lacustris]|uniref:Uncharacterized protein n=1 Tax=Haematococcus lacustris TaxID=44745 RepID=A0A6A0AB51_HAELA|nr:hypothetical protein HaLaN_27910 [Haematococcus lacustris]